MSEPKRLFFAIELPDEVREQIIASGAPVIFPRTTVGRSPQQICT